MAEITYTQNGETLTVCAAGRIDSTNAADCESKITGICQSCAHTAVEIDADRLEYISSAGLRIILKLIKSEKNIKIVNASPEVYEILDMTGFTEMMKVEKAYRRMSVEGCEVIGRGANGKVYRIDPETIIKVYLNPDCLPDIQRERELARRAFVLGIPTAIPYDIVRVGEGYGSVFELLNAKSLAHLMQENPDKLDEYISVNVGLLKKIHSTEVKPGDMPDMREVALKWAYFMKDYLPGEKYGKLVRLISDVPVVHRMMHGDYHVKNVMMQNGEALLIDMDTLCQGHPVFELASMYNAYVGFSIVDRSQSMAFLGLEYPVSEAIWKKSLRMYLGSDDEKYVSDVEKKAMLIGLMRLYRRLRRRNGADTEAGRAELEAYMSNILRLLDEVDSLVF